MQLAPRETLGEALDLEERELRSGEHHKAGALVPQIVAGVDSLDVGIGDDDFVHRGLAAESGAFRPGLRGDAHHVEHPHRAVARERAAHLLQLVGKRRAVVVGKHRHSEVILMALADDFADHAPIREVAERRAQAHAQRSLAMSIEMKTILGRAAGDRRGERRRPAFEIGAGAVDGVSIDHRPCIAPGDMLAQVRLIDGLVVDAGVGSNDVQRMQMTDQAPLFFDLGRVLPELFRVRKIDAARVGRDRNAAMSPLRATVGEKRQAAVAHHLDVAHHVSVGDGYEALGVKEAPDFDLIGDRFTHGLALTPVEHRLFFRGQPHRSSPTLTARSIPAATASRRDIVNPTALSKSSWTSIVKDHERRRAPGGHRRPVAGTRSPASKAWSAREGVKQ